MPQTQITMDNKMGQKDAELMLAWLQLSLAHYVSEGVEITLERERDATILLFTCDDEALLSEATDAFVALASSSAREG